MFSLKKFTDITAAQISTLIDTMQKKIDLQRQAAGNETINQLHVRMFDPVGQKLLYSNLIPVGQNQGIVMYFPIGEANKAVDESGLDFNLPTTRFDRQNHLMYHYDIFIDEAKEDAKWMIDWDDKKLQWVAYLMDNEEATEVKEPLYKFKNPLVIGNTYTGIKE